MHHMPLLHTLLKEELDQCTTARLHYDSPLETFTIEREMNFPNILSFETIQTIHIHKSNMQATTVLHRINWNGIGQFSIHV